MMSKAMSGKRVLALWNDEGQNLKDTSVLRKKSAELPVPLDKEGREAVQALIDSHGTRRCSGLAASDRH